MKKNHYLAYGNVDAWRERLSQSPDEGHLNTEDWNGFEIFGSLPSPPCVKVATYLRWKRIPFLWRSTIDDNMKMMFDEPRFSHIEEPIMPIAVFPDGRSMNDSSFIIRAIEEQNPKRSVIPSLDEDPCLRFICQLLEDFSDEWLVRCVYGFRWNDPDVRQFSGRLVNLSFLGGGEMSRGAIDFIISKQLGTQDRADAFVEGAYSDNIIYPTFHRVSDAMERHFAKGMRADKFMCGNAPASVDFAFYGMFYQFIQDKIPAPIMAESYPHVTAWIHRMNDTSGFAEAPLKVTELLSDLLKIAGDSYLPFLAANAASLDANPESDDLITVPVFQSEGEAPVIHTQKPYAYQAKCLQWLKEDLAAALDSPNTSATDELKTILDSCGCLTQLKP